MKFFFWNCCGIGNDNTRCCLFNYCTMYSSGIIGIAEPMVSFSSLTQRFFDKIGMVLVAVNTVEFPTL